MNYRDEDELRSRLVTSLLEVWQSNVETDTVQRLKNSPACLRLGGVTFVAPTQGKLRAVGDAAIKFVDSQLNQDSELTWDSKMAEGMAADVTQINTSRREGRNIWIAIPLSACSMARVWAVCDSLKADSLVPIRINTILPRYLRETYLTDLVLIPRFQTPECAHWFSVRTVENWRGEDEDQPNEEESDVDDRIAESLEFINSTFGEFGNALLNGIEEWSSLLERDEVKFR